MFKKALSILSILIFKLYASGFNVDVNFPIIYKDPFANKFQRSSYFGFSVMLNDSWIIIGAPRANYSNMTLHEPGVAYKCGIKGGCAEIHLPEAEKASKNAEYFSNAWFGVAMDQSDTGQAVVCGHRWRTPDVISIGPKLPGTCYWFQEKDKTGFIRPIPGKRAEDLTVRVNNRTYYKASLSQSGMAVHILPASRKKEGIFFGSPGYYNWKGAVVQHENILQHGDKTFAKVTDTSKSATFIAGHSYFGYHVSSGCFEAKDKCLLVAGAPRGQKESHVVGSVSLFDFPGKGKSFWTFFRSTNPSGVELPETSKQQTLRKHLYGSQEGESFGASFAVADFTGDGLDDLVVGAPLFSDPRGDEGRIYLFEGLEGDVLRNVSSMNGEKPGSRFGTAVASVGDLDQDGCQDIAVGAPYEGNGAVYIFYGNREGSLSSPRRIAAEELFTELRGFGISFSAMADVDGNKYKDIAVGAFLSGHAVILRSRPVVTLQTSIQTYVDMLQSEDTLKVQMCLSYSGKNVPANLTVIRRVSIDETHRRASPPYMEDFNVSLRDGEKSCVNISFSLKNGTGTLEPLEIKLSQELQRTQIQGRPIYNTGGRDDFDPQDPVERKSLASESVVSIPFKTTCGDTICIARVNLICFLKNNGHYFNKTFVIGKYNSLQLQVNITNIGNNTIYSSTMGINLPVGIRFEKTPSFCEDDSSNYISCNLFTIGSNPKIFTFELDMTNVQLQSKGHEIIQNVQIKVTTNSTADGRQRSLESCTVPLSLTVNTSVSVYGKSQRDIYPLTKTDTKMEIIHIYEVHRQGYSPVREFRAEFRIPAKVITTKGPVHILSSSPRIYGGHSVHCDNDQQPDLERPDGGGMEEDPGIPEVSRSKRSVEQFSNHSSAYIPPANQTLYLNCSLKEVECQKIVCFGGELEAKTLKLRLILNIPILRYLMGRKNIVFLSSEIQVGILNPRVRTRFLQAVSSPIIAEVQEIKVSLWVYVCSSVGGLLLLMLVAMGLAKGGFFQRKQKAELEALMQKETETETSKMNPEESDES